MGRTQETTDIIYHVKFVFHRQCARTSGAGLRSDSGVADSLAAVWCPAVQSELGVITPAVTCQRVCSLIASRDELPRRVPAIDGRGQSHDAVWILKQQAVSLPSLLVFSLVIGEIHVMFAIDQ